MSDTSGRRGYPSTDLRCKRNFCNATSKVCYKSRSDAKKSRRLIRRKQRREGADREVAIYQCPFCHDYHVGTRERR